MKEKWDNTTLWNEAGKGALFLGGLSVLCLSLRELSTASGSNFLISAARVILWVVEFFGCILLMKRFMLDFRDKYAGVKMSDTAILGRRMGLLSGLLLASAQVLFVLRMPEGQMNEMVSQLSAALPMTAADQEYVESLLPRLPLYTFLIQWLYCYLYGSVLASILSRYIFMKAVLGTQFREFGKDPEEDQPDEQ